MFIIRWIRTLASLPVLWLGQLLSRFGAHPGVPLLKAAWAVGRDAEAGREALSAVRRFDGVEAATALAESWLARYRCPQFAAIAGLLALERDDAERAALMLQAGRAVGDDPLGALEWLEFLIADRRGDAQAVAQSLRMRSDLPPQLSHAILVELMYDCLLRGRFEEARDRANHLLDISEDPQAEAVLWALARRDGDLLSASNHLKLIKLSAADKNYCLFIGCTAIGARLDAAQALESLRRQNERLAQHAERYVAGKEPHVA